MYAIGGTVILEVNSLAYSRAEMELQRIGIVAELLDRGRSEDFELDQCFDNRPNIWKTDRRE